MHRGHDHDHHHHGGHAGHNSQGQAAQWQTPHLPEGQHRQDGAATADADLVEDAFVAAFPGADDPTSFLRLAGIPFVGEARDGATCRLLRVEIGETTDVGVLTPQIGGAGHRYDPLPAKMTSRRQTLAFAYFDGVTVRRLTFAEARELKDMTP